MFRHKKTKQTTRLLCRASKLRVIEVALKKYNSSISKRKKTFYDENLKKTLSNLKSRSNKNDFIWINSRRKCFWHIKKQTILKMQSEQKFLRTLIRFLKNCFVGSDKILKNSDIQSWAFLFIFAFFRRLQTRCSNKLNFLGSNQTLESTVSPDGQSWTALNFAKNASFSKIAITSSSCIHFKILPVKKGKKTQYVLFCRLASS